MNNPQMQNPIDVRLAAFQVDLLGTLTTPCHVAINGQAVGFKKEDLVALEKRLSDIARDKDWKPSWSDYLRELTTTEKTSLIGVVAHHLQFLDKMKVNEMKTDMLAMGVGALDLVGRGSWQRTQADRFVEAGKIIRDSLQHNLRMT